MIEQLKRRRANDGGFTLIELLIAIVVVGILATVVIVGIAGLNNNGKTAACKSSMDATKAAIAVHYSNTGAYPGTFLAMTSANELDVPTGATVTNGTPPAASTLTANGWTLTLTPGAGAPALACS